MPLKCVQIFRRSIVFARRRFVIVVLQVKNFFHLLVSHFNYFLLWVVSLCFFLSRFPIVENNTVLSQRRLCAPYARAIWRRLSPLEVFFEFVSILNKLRLILRKVLFFKSFKVWQRLPLPQDVFLDAFYSVEQEERYSVGSIFSLKAILVEFHRVLRVRSVLLFIAGLSYIASFHIWRWLLRVIKLLLQFGD